MALPHDQLVNKLSLRNQQKLAAREPGFFHGYTSRPGLWYDVAQTAIGTKRHQARKTWVDAALPNFSEKLYNYHDPSHILSLNSM